ncbi:MAG: hypothetical protein IJP66_03765 [Kiritimatiellae bacterium]|nr:hypothetical protein [Kiritimatiellia bacterium]
MTKTPLLPFAACMVLAATPARAAECVFAPGAEDAADVADALQAFVEANPNCTIHLPDGVYPLSHPIATPAEPRRTVSLALDDFAILKAAPDFPPRELPVRLRLRH